MCIRDSTSNDVTIPIGFLVAHGLPFNILIGCDILRQHTATIDLRRGNPSKANCQVIGSHYCTTNRMLTIPQYEDDNPELCQDKLEEIREFQRTRTSNQISEAQAEQLIGIYNKYQHIFSNAPGKVKDYQCTISFKTPVDFHRKSYPIAYSLKKEVREELNRMMENDIIAVSYTHLDVYKRQVRAG